MKSINQEEFFKLIAINSGISDLSLVKDIYYGIVRTMSRELRDKHIIKIPDWGEFNLKMYKSRDIVNVNNGKLRTVPAKLTLKFQPDYKVRKYFHSLSE